MLNFALAVALAVTPADDDVQHDISVTFSPLHLTLPVFETTGEYRAMDDLGVAAVLGYGRVGNYSAYEVGGQVRYYVVGSFIHGMQLGAEILYLSIDNDATASGIAASASGLSMGPFLGYKIATNIGFTFDAQLGGTYNLVQAEATDGETSASSSGAGFGVLLNLNVGWSF